MEAAWTWIAGLVLGCWLAASAVHQLRQRWWARIARYDALSLLPAWSFFAPNPGRHDLHLVYRERCGDRTGQWRALEPGGDDLRWRWFWNPSRYPRKAVHDLTNGLVQTVRANAATPRAVMLSSSYLAALEWVTSQPAGIGVTHRQFALVASGGGSERELEVRFLSEQHPL